MPHEEQLELEAPVEGEGVGGELEEALAGAVPEEGVVPEGAGPSELDQLLSEIDGLTPEPAAQEPQGSADLAGLLDRARQELGAAEDGDDRGLLVDRIEKLEGSIQQMSQRNESLRKESIKKDINGTITGAITSEISRLELDPTGSAAKAFGRIISDGTLVAIAKAQAITGKPEVDSDSIRQTVKKWSKLVERVAGELAAHKTSKQRRAPSGAAPSAFTSPQDVATMSSDDFDKAVIAALRSG